jgi:hypothetical protein
MILFIISLLFLGFVNSSVDCNCSGFTNCILTGDCSISLSNGVTLDDDDVLIESNTETYEYTLNGNENITINSDQTLTFSNLKV